MIEDYNEQIMGAIDFIISYDKDIVPDKDVTHLIKDIVETLNDKYKHMNIHFRVSDIENQTWFELNGLVQLAHNRRNQQLPPLHIVNSYLTNSELSRFMVLSHQLSDEGKST